MLFRYTENPPENTIFTPAALRVSAVAFSYTENSSFPYTRVQSPSHHALPAHAQNGPAVGHARPLAFVLRRMLPTTTTG